MNYHQVLVQVQLAHIFTETAVHGESQRQLLLHLFLYVVVDLMREQLLPADPVLGVGPQHSLYQGFTHLADAVDGPWELYVLLADHLLQLVDVFGVVGRPELKQKHLPNSIQ